MTDHKTELFAAADLVHKVQPATPQYSWPLLNELLGTQVYVKHENHTATGAFKIRGGITFMHWLKQAHPQVTGIVTATRGNHGQSQARAATSFGIKATIVVPENNSHEKNLAMEAFGGEVIKYGKDFDESREHAAELANQHNWYRVPPYHHHIVLGVASYAVELFNAIQHLDTVYVPIGCGSGICGLIAARDAMGLKTEIVGVVSTQADAAKRSFESGNIIETPSANTFADGMAVRRPVPEAFEIYKKGAARIVSVSDDEVAAAILHFYRSTHNVAEGAGAASLAAAIQEKHKLAGKKIAVILCGGNIDTDVFATVLKGLTPQP